VDREKGRGRAWSGEFEEHVDRILGQGVKRPMVADDRAGPVGRLSSLRYVPLRGVMVSTVGRSARSGRSQMSASSSFSVMTASTAMCRAPRWWPSLPVVERCGSRRTLDVTVSGTSAVQTRQQCRTSASRNDGPQQPAGVEIRYREQSKLEGDHLGEDVVAASDRPEQLRLVVGVDVQDQSRRSADDWYSPSGCDRSAR
jgi:hypothetical protein